MTNQLLIIGCGNMGGAMLAGWLAAGVDPARLSVLDPALSEAPAGVALYRDAAAVPSTHDAVLLGFKPQQLGQLGPGLQGLTTGRTVYSLLAGIRLDQLQAAFPGAAAHVRVMPNLAARINKSPVILAEAGLDAARRDAAFALFGQLGTALWLDGEAQFDLVTALAGSGPGFVYRFIDALAGAAADLGLDQASADALALATVEGAAALAATSDVGPATLADRVASPGGMTREGLNVLDEEAALRRLLTETLRATAAKGAALSKGS
ncbi:MAG: pyrroline-5-carboxylate reductase dimerization domain-containing protein [Erythrobacter sp.]|jgi:pyrroline-5-carboxylate reductase|uniref:pyrroline-5-carboxylate reductase family protein n=1 Tax=Erythrobacter sp. TaxID=1042 RepID=UPI002B46F5F8|nr:pyrroline-5-carboxylate reductase dimerization domain-containing protein [Erythrobacter sp.]WRH70358.1 MAG: pyrroline-5-carboxylate reductase dimerization domain-containing protein [Erythrobacter sp.]